VRKTLLATTLLLAAMTVPAGATTTHGRTETVDYTAPGGVQGVINGGTTADGQTTGFAMVALTGKEHTVRVALTDQSGLPVPFDLGVDTGGNAARDLGSFCESTGKPVTLPKRSRTLIVYLDAGTCGAAASTATTGTATLVFR
jgi:hypothetical protein